jgi:hypothetical protein
MKKILTIIIGILVSLVLIITIAGFAMHKSLPAAETGAEADALARKMLDAINKEAWDNTAYVRWSFQGGHDYVWNKKRGLIEVKWKNKRVILYSDGKLAKAWQDGEELGKKEAEKLRSSAWAYFCNDSFWLNAPAKVFDPGTTRGIVTQKDGKDALLVTYNSGGVTPGDAYLWLLDEKGLPVAWRMWVKIIPIGGIKVSWENWQTLPTGAKLASTHDAGIAKFTLDGIKGGNRLEDIGLTEDPFRGM